MSCFSYSFVSLLNKNRPRLKFLETGPVRIQSLAVPLKLRTKMRPFRLQQALGTDVACTESPTDGSRVWAFSSEGIRSSPSPARLPPSPALCKVDHADPSSSSLFYSVVVILHAKTGSVNIQISQIPEDGVYSQTIFLYKRNFFISFFMDGRHYSPPFPILSSHSASL